MASTPVLLLLGLLLVSAHARLNGTERRLPDVLIIGAKKSGTRALLRFLGTHPGVRAAKKETHFLDRHWDKGVDWYR